ncbi:MAG: response regulator [Candidatus Sumerlaeota bacterium]|nr:response regulator [Candidatus Sumerlaeota bacterium]
MRAGKAILLVEDNPDDEVLAMRALKKSDRAQDVIVAHDGLEALKYLCGDSASGEPPKPLPQVVLLDIKLPKIDGLETLRRIRSHERTHLLPVVILTSSHEDRDRLECYRIGANSYIRKPVDFVQFTEAVRQIGVYWLSLNEAPPLERSH